MQSKSLKNVLLHVSFGRSLFAFLLSVPKTIASESKHKIVQSAEYTDAQVHVGDKRWQQICILFPAFLAGNLHKSYSRDKIVFHITTQNLQDQDQVQSMQSQYICTAMAVHMNCHCSICVSVLPFLFKVAEFHKNLFVSLMQPTLQMYVEYLCVVK